MPTVPSSSTWRTAQSTGRCRHGPPTSPATTRYDRGWDAIREERFERQKQLGLFAPDTALPARNSEPGHEVEAWDSLSAEQRSLYARYMEVYAAMIDNVDQNLARLLDTIESLGDLDNTIVVFTSDNGATEEGGATGSRSYYKQFGGFRGLTGWDGDVARDPELIGGPRALVHYPRLGDGVEHALPPVQVLHTRRRSAGADDRVVARRHPSGASRRDPHAVPVCDRPPADDPRAGRRRATR